MIFSVNFLVSKEVHLSSGNVFSKNLLGLSVGHYKNFFISFVEVFFFLLSTYLSPPPQRGESTNHGQWLHDFFFFHLQIRVCFFLRCWKSVGVCVLCDCNCKTRSHIFLDVRPKFKNNFKLITSHKKNNDLIM